MSCEALEHVDSVIARLCDCVAVIDETDAPLSVFLWSCRPNHPVTGHTPHSLANGQLHHATFIS